MVRVAFDIRPALGRLTGVGSFAEQLVLAMDGREGDHRLLLFTSSLKERWPAGRLAGLRRSEIVDRKWPVSLLNFLWHRSGRPRVELFTGRVDVAHSPTPLLLPSRARKVVTLHDLHFLRRPEHTRAEIRRDYPALVRRHVHGADAVLAVSRATAEDAVEHLGLPGERIVVCGEDAAPEFDAPPTEEELARSATAFPSDFILFVGTIEPRKNLQTLIRALSLLRQRLPELSLVIGGDRGWGCEEFDAALASAPAPDRVTITGYLDRPRLRALYHRARALVMPSICEGFGLPLVEAMACGCPLIVADRSALPEVAGEAALLWGGEDVEELAGLIERVVTDSRCRDDLIARGRARRKHFSWNKTADRVLRLYNELSGREP